MNNYLLILFLCFVFQTTVWTQKKEQLQYKPTTYSFGQEQNPSTGAHNAPVDVCAIMQKYSKKHKRAVAHLSGILNSYIYELLVLFNQLENIHESVFEPRMYGLKAREREIEKKIENISGYIESIKYALDCLNRLQ